MNKIKRSFVCVIIGLLITTSFGCEPLRKKFTRKKKEKDTASQFVPVLDPIDYPPKLVTAEESYKHYYSLWKVWHRDLVDNLDEGATDKKFKYLTGQAILQLEEMGKRLSQEMKQDDLKLMIDQYVSLQSEFDRPEQMRNLNTIKNDLEQIRKTITNDFNPKLELEYVQSDL